MAVTPLCQDGNTSSIAEGGEAGVTVARSGDLWSAEPPVRDVGSISVALRGAVVHQPGESLSYRVVFAGDERAERAANAYLADLADTFARPLTLRSYAYDILRWLRFLAAIDVRFDCVVRTDYSDFVRWLLAHGKTGGARRARRVRAVGRRNPLTGKTGPDDVAFDAATLAHSRVVLHEWYEFMACRGEGPLVNPIPHSARADRGGRLYVHHNPLEDFSRARPGRRLDPPKAERAPRHLSDDQYERFWAELRCDRDRAMVKVAVDSGVRPGELLAMVGADIDWGDALVHVVRKGGRRAQWIPVSRNAMVWLRRYQARTGYVAGPTDPVWVTARGPRRPLDYDAWRAVFARVNARLGTDWTPHDLRHFLPRMLSPPACRPTSSRS